MDMSYRPLGASGLMVSVLGVGCNAFGARTEQHEVDEIVGSALDAGITLFDTADSYSSGASEQMLGKALGARRDEAVIATKFGMDTGGLYGNDHGVRASRRYIRQAVEGSLARLGTDHIDLYQLHTPDRTTPLAETLETLSDLVAEGLVRYIGCSNFTAWEVAVADGLARDLGSQRFISAQNEYSLYNRSAEAELVPCCEQLGIGILPYFPLAYGLLTGKYRRGEAAPSGSRLEQQSSRLEGADFDRVEALQAYADERGIDLLTLAVSGLAAQPGVASVISGVSRPAQIASNLKAASWTPSDDDLAALDEIAPRGAGTGYASFASPLS